MFPLCLLFVLLSCDTNREEELICGTSDPLTELTWLRDMKSYFEMRMSPAGAQIIRYRYEGEDVFWIEDPCCSAESPYAIIYNCQGEAICKFNAVEICTCPDFKELATDSTMLFSNVN